MLNNLYAAYSAKLVKIFIKRGLLVCCDQVIELNKMSFFLPFFFSKYKKRGRQTYGQHICQSENRTAEF